MQSCINQIVLGQNMNHVKYNYHLLTLHVTDLHVAMIFLQEIFTTLQTSFVFTTKIHIFPVHTNVTC